MDNRNPLRLRFDTFDLDEKEARLSQSGQPIALPPKAFSVLCALARQPGQLVTKTELLDAVWGHQHVSESVLKTVISELRAALSDDAKQPRYIETASRRGYRFIATASPHQAHDLSAVAESPSGNVPTHMQRSDTPLMIGRQPAIGLLRVAWDNALAGRRQMFWITGEAGVGKTTLIDNFASALGPIRCAHGQCVEQRGAGEPYLPVLEALGALCRDDPVLPPILRTVAPTWLLQLPWLSNEAERSTLRRELAGVGHERMLRELGEVLERYTQLKPLLLITEDLHWSDHTTIQLIDYVARRRGMARLMWLGSFRLAEVIAEEHPLKELRHELRLHNLCKEVTLDPFSEQEVADYLAKRFPEHEVSEPIVRALHARTDGLPLFVVNLVDDLNSHGALVPEASDTQVEVIESLQVPENLAGVIERQIVRLSPEEQTLLETASVCGMEFRASTLGTALKRDTRWVGDRCDELARRQQWLSTAGVSHLHDGTLSARYSFLHALYRQVFYQRMGVLARAQAHQSIAAALEGERKSGVVTAAELALHYERSHDFVAAMRCHAEAAESALRHFAPREALNLSTHARSLLPHCPPGTVRDALELNLVAMSGVSAAQLFGVSSLEAKRAFERARTLLAQLPQHPLRSLILHGSGIVLMMRGEYAEARALGEEIRELSKKFDDRVLLLSACSVMGQIHSFQGRQLEALQWLEQGVATCEELGDETLQASFVVDPGVTMYGALSLPLLHLGQVDRGRKCLDTASTRARRLGQPMALLVATWFAAAFEVRLGNTDRVAKLADEMRAVVEDAALAQGYGPSRWYQGWVEARLGSPQVGHRLIRDAFEHNMKLGSLSASPEVLGYAAEALILASDWDAAQNQLNEALQLAERLSERAYLPQLLLLQARIDLAQNKPEAARTMMHAAVYEAREQQALWQELTALVALCEIDDPASEDFEALRVAYARLTEGVDTSLATKVRKLLHISVS